MPLVRYFAAAQEAAGRDTEHGPRRPVVKAQEGRRRARVRRRLAGVLPQQRDRAGPEPSADIPQDVDHTRCGAAPVRGRAHGQLHDVDLRRTQVGPRSKDGFPGALRPHEDHAARIERREQGGTGAGSARVRIADDASSLPGDGDRGYCGGIDGRTTWCV